MDRGVVHLAPPSGQSLDFVSNAFLLSWLDVPRLIGDLSFGMIDRRHELPRAMRRTRSLCK